MADISVTESDPGEFAVTVTEAGSSTTHRVSADAATIGRLAPGHDGVEIVAASFRFLLDREPKEAILHTFDLSVIGRYFPEYEAALGSYLGR